jgi:hypothetical protein
MAMHMCRQTKSIPVHTHMHKTDLPIDTTNGMHVISSTPMRGDSSAELFLLLHTAEKIKVIYIIPQHNDIYQRLDQAHESGENDGKVGK